jgi:hypothetical protein
VSKPGRVMSCDANPLAGLDPAEFTLMQLQEATRIALHAFRADPEYLVLFAKAADRADRRRQLRRGLTD